TRQLSRAYENITISLNRIRCFSVTFDHVTSRSITIALWQHCGSELADFYRCYSDLFWAIDGNKIRSDKAVAIVPTTSATKKGTKFVTCWVRILIQAAAGS
ncbi:MAG: hypothetical protein RLN85_13045, partial [Pseudomonadales bacterium]